MADIDGRVVTMELADLGDVGVLRNTSTFGSASEISFAADDTTLVRGTSGVALWDVTDDRQLAVWPDEHIDQSTAAQDPDGGTAMLDIGRNGWALSARSDGSLTLWQVRLDEAITVLCDLAGEMSGEDRARYVRDVEISSPCVS